MASIDIHVTFDTDSWESVREISQAIREAVVKNRVDSEYNSKRVRVEAYNGTERLHEACL